jgi:gluconolactonase
MIFLEGLEHPESLLLMKDGSWLVSEVAPGNGKLTRVSALGKERKTFAGIGRPNGLLRDPVDGGVWVAETWGGSLVKLRSDGKEMGEVRSDGQRDFLWPNDMVLGPDDHIYMTDSGILARDLITDDGPDPDVWEGEMQGRLFRINPADWSVECLDEGFRFANGIAFGPDGKLYLNETVTGNIYRYEFTDRLLVETRELFVCVTDSTGPCRVVGPDGMTFDQEGNLYVAMFGQGHVATVYPNGEIHRTIVTRGSCPTDVSFGVKGSRQLYISEYQRGRIEIASVPHDGFTITG